MRDDGFRLSFSIGTDSFSIADNLSGKTIIDIRGNFTADTLDVDVVLEHLRNLQEAILSYKEKPLFMKAIPTISSNSSLVIRENAHYDWTLGFMGKGAQLHDNTFTYTRGFNKEDVLSLINKTYATLLTKTTNLNPKRDIVRRIADVGLLVWVHDGHSVVTYEKNVAGNCMVNCMVDGNFFPVLIVSTSRDLGQTTLFTTSLEEIISFPTDNSILTFYPADEEAFED